MRMVDVIERLGEEVGVSRLGAEGEKAWLDVQSEVEHGVIALGLRLLWFARVERCEQELKV